MGTALCFLRQMAEGFLALVKEGVIHRYLICLFRDLKPENILIKGTTLKDAKIKIADFGYAKNASMIQCNFIRLLELLYTCRHRF